MSTVGLSYPKTSEVEYEEFVNIVLKNFKELDWIFSGKLDFKNIQAEGITTKNLHAEAVTAAKILANTITALQIAANAIESDKIKAGAVTADKITVTELSAITANLGHIISGLIESIEIYGSYIATANGTYPRTEMSTADNLFAAYQSATQYIKITPDASAGNPGLTYRNGSALGFLYQLTTDLLLATSAGSANVQISSGKDLFLSANNGSGYKVKVQSWSALVETAFGVSLQSALNAKANSFSGFTGSFVSGAQTVTVSNGIIISVV